MWIDTLIILHTKKAFWKYNTIKLTFQLIKQHFWYHFYFEAFIWHFNISHMPLQFSVTYDNNLPHYFLAVFAFFRLARKSRVEKSGVEALSWNVLQPFDSLLIWFHWWVCHVIFFGIWGWLCNAGMSLGFQIWRGECTVMRFLDLKETSTDMAADWIFKKFKLI